MDATESKIFVILPKGSEESQSFEIYNCGYNMCVPRDTATFRSLMEAIEALQLDDWTEDTYNDFIEKHVGEDQGDDKAWLLDYTDKNDWRYNNHNMVIREKGYALQSLDQLKYAREVAIEMKAKSNELNVEEWVNSISKRLGGGTISFTTNLA